MYSPGGAKPLTGRLLSEWERDKKDYGRSTSRKRSFQLGEIKLVNAVGCVFKQKKLKTEEDCFAEERYENKLSGRNG